MRRKEREREFLEIRIIVSYRDTSKWLCARMNTFSEHFQTDQIIVVRDYRQVW
jgi:hypothetical protein